MSFASFAVGCGLLGLLVGSIAWGVFRLRAHLVPEWSWPLSRLVEVVLGLGVLITIGEVLGTIGLFRRWAVVATAVLIGVGIGVISGRAPSRKRGPFRVGPAAVLSGASAVLVFTLWLVRVLIALDHGLAAGDTQAYHMPFAARFVQTGWITHLHFIEPAYPVSTWNPNNSELLHGLMILPFGHDVVAPFVNLGVLVLTLLAAWCIGEHRGAGPAAMTGAALVLATPLLVGSQPGSAMNDLTAVFFLLSASAFLLAGWDRQSEALGGRWRIALLLAGLAAGWGLGTKLSLDVAVGAVTIALVGVAVRRRDRMSMGWWAAGLLVGGSYWYARNLFLVGNPVPTLHDGLPTPSLDLLARYGFSILHYATDAHVWRTVFRPALHIALGPLWPLLVSLPFLAMVALLLKDRDLVVRVLAAVAIAAAVGYVVTPGTAWGPEGTPTLPLVAANVRILAPALVLAAALLPLLPALARRQTAVTAALGVALLAEQTSAGLWPAERRLAAIVLAAALVGVIAVVGWVALADPARPVRTPQLVGAALLILATAALVLGQRVQHHYLAGRFGDNPLAVWARTIGGQRIAFSGLYQNYALYGPDLSNRVDAPGRPAPHHSIQPAGSCQTWREDLVRGHYRYVVTGPEFPDQPEPVEAVWTRSDPHARTVLQAGPTTVFLLSAPPTPASCP